MGFRVRGTLAVRPSEDAKGVEVIVESTGGLRLFGPFFSAQEAERVLHEALELMLPQPNAPTSSPAR